jgi:hypothetical protein
VTGVKSASWAQSSMKPDMAMALEADVLRVVTHVMIQNG